jgi:hypothetical protein
LAAGFAWSAAVKSIGEANFQAFGQIFGQIFGLGSAPIRVVKHGSGHIHGTYRATYPSAQGSREVLHQAINTTVFGDPAALMHNIAQVTQTLASGLRRTHPGDWQRRVLQIVPTRSGKLFAVDERGQHWRTYEFIGDSFALDQVDDPHWAFHAAQAFGEFQAQLTEYQGPPLRETIDRFHDTPHRWLMFERALCEDVVGRTRAVQREIEALHRMSDLQGQLIWPLQSGELPLRIAHNDTKINNILFDERTRKPLCVVDLDTVMAGTSLFDFGDLVRSTVASGLEDGFETAVLRFDIFEALVQGWCRACLHSMCKLERELLVTSAQVLTFEVALRFLTDYLQGDRYFRVHHNEHNLERARSQIALAQALLGQRDALEQIVARVLRTNVAHP